MITGAVSIILSGLKVFISGECSGNRLQGTNRVELNHISHQSGQDGDRSSSTRESPQNHGGGGEGLHDERAANNHNLNKTHAATKGESSMLKVNLIPGSHGIFNSSVMKANIFKTLEESVCRT